jgi:hypothetical protein
VVRDLADCFVDHRDPRYVEHGVQELLEPTPAWLGPGLRRPQ